MKKIGLALSGGGFRATLFHLGLLRFLRDAGILSHVTHITSVSGGSIIAAHLALNWQRYVGSERDFDAVAAELLAFTRLDVRNRILRRFPFAIPLCWLRRLFGLSIRSLTQTGLLESQYQQYLYGDTSLFELPACPQLHILATNVSEGCLCSFNRKGLLTLRRQSSGTIHLEATHVGLATVAMAVAASSAFPGFFPPLELTGADVGVARGEFGIQSYTDGGVFDNLGVRMFRCLERKILADSPLCQDDFVDFQSASKALAEVNRSTQETPLRRLTQIMVTAYRRTEPLLIAHATATAESAHQPGTASAPALISIPQLAAPGALNGVNDELMLAGLGNLLRQYPIQFDPYFSGLKPERTEAEALLRASRLGGRALDPNDQLWLNRHLIDAAFRQETGHPCFRKLDSDLDVVLVSDVGKPMEVRGNQRAGGLIRAALRASDILMDRVWQLEKETFYNTPGFVFVPITAVVEPSEDAMVLDPETQRQAANIRTDLDRFSDLEISCLVRHGYCVGRKICRSRPDLFGNDLPANAPWDPVQGRTRSSAASMPVASQTERSSKAPSPSTLEARTLHASAIRRIWSTLLDYRDWVSYIYVPIIIPIFFLTPYFIFKSYQHSARVNHIVESLSQGSRDLEVMTRLLEGVPKPWTGETAEQVSSFDKPDFQGFEVLQDSRVLDMRTWNPATSGTIDPNSLSFGYRRLKVRKLPEKSSNHVFRIKLLPTSPKTQVRFPPQQIQPKLRVQYVEDPKSDDKTCIWEMSADFSKVPDGAMVDLLYEYYSPALFLKRSDGSSSLAFDCEVDTAEVNRWLLMPLSKEYRDFNIVRYPKGSPEKAEEVKVVTEYLADDYTILAYKLLSVKGGYTYELTWHYKW